MMTQINPRPMTASSGDSSLNSLRSASSQQLLTYLPTELHQHSSTTQTHSPSSPRHGLNLRFPECIIQSSESRSEFNHLPATHQLLMLSCSNFIYLCLTLLPVSEMTYAVSSGTLNPSILYHTIDTITCR